VDDEDSSHNILTLDALQVLSGSQVTLGCQCPCGYSRYEVYIHTYKQIFLDITKL
jgi:hypothetical protein